MADIDILNEDCLLQIFEHLDPLDWLHVSDVCRFWRKTIARKWKKLGTKIVLDSHEDELKTIYFENVLTSGELEERSFDPRLNLISLKDARHLIRQAGPSARSLTDKRYKGYLHPETVLQIGPLTYKVENDYQNIERTHEELFKVIVHSSKKLTELHLNRTPNEEELKILFGRKQITKVVANNVDLSAAYECQATDRIEELVLSFYSSTEHLRSFEGHFSNLMKLQLDVKLNFPQTELYAPLSLILPFVTNRLKVLYLSVENNHSLKIDLASECFANIFNFEQLEEFGLSTPDDATVRSTDYFFNKLVSSCPKLRVVHIFNVLLSDDTILKLLSLSQLETIYMRPNSSFFSKEIPEMKNMSKCYLSIDKFNPRRSSYDVIIRMFQKMPKLRYIGLASFSRNGVLQIVYEVLARFSTKQVVIVMEYSLEFGFNDLEERQKLDELIVVKKKEQKEVEFCNEEVLTLSLVMINFYGLLYDVQNYLKMRNWDDRHAYVVKNEKR